MATDLVHTVELVSGVIAVLKGADDEAHTGGLPANWFADAADDEEQPLVLCQHGDLADYPASTWPDLTPGIIVRGLGGRVLSGGTGGVLKTVETVRIIHLRMHEHCYDADGNKEDNMTIARGYYAKAIGKALRNDPHQRLAVIAADTTRTDLSLTSSDGAGAQVVNVVQPQWDFGEELGGANLSMEEVRIIRQASYPMWAIGYQFDVHIRCGGES